jgi:hypothetical protein
MNIIGSYLRDKQLDINFLGSGDTTTQNKHPIAANSKILSL